MNIKPALLAASIALATSGTQAAVNTNVAHDMGVLSFSEADIVMTSETRAERRAARQAARAERRAARRAARQAARAERRAAVNNNGGTVLRGTGDPDFGIPDLVSVPGPAPGQQPSQAQVDALIAANFPNGLPTGSRIRSITSEGVRILVRGRTRPITRTFPFN